MVKAAKAGGSGLAARMPAKPVDPVAAGLDAAVGETVAPAEPELPLMPEAVTPAAPSKGKAEVVTLNIRLPKELHRALRKIAFDDETSINSILIEAAELWIDTTN